MNDDKPKIAPATNYQVMLNYDGNGGVQLMALVNGTDIFSGVAGPPALILEGLAAELNRALDAAIKNTQCVWRSKSHLGLRPTPVPNGP